MERFADPAADFVGIHNLHRLFNEILLESYGKKSYNNINCVGYFVLIQLKQRKEEVT